MMRLERRASLLIAFSRLLIGREAALLRDVQTEGERLWKAVPQWHWTVKPLDELVPPSYPVRGEH